MRSDSPERVEIVMTDALAIPQTRLIPAGSFRMGSAEWEHYPGESPETLVYLDAFEIGIYPVTNAEYAGFLEATGYEKPPWWEDPRFNDPRQPVVGVNWYDAVAYCRWLRRVTGEPYRLPTDAEWEKAARGGLEGKAYPWGDDPPTLERCWWGGQERPKPVGSFPPNGYGLYDMIGNVWEWCADWYNPQYFRHPPRRNPRGPRVGEGENKVIRGGSFLTPKPEPLRCAYRHPDHPTLRHECIGFRVAKSVRRTR